MREFANEASMRAEMCVCQIANYESRDVKALVKKAFVAGFNRGASFQERLQLGRIQDRPTATLNKLLRANPAAITEICRVRVEANSRLIQAFDHPVCSLDAPRKYVVTPLRLVNATMRSIGLPMIGARFSELTFDGLPAIHSFVARDQG